jgi:extracellular elastinolytic metalloproteinase
VVREPKAPSASSPAQPVHRGRPAKLRRVVAAVACLVLVTGLPSVGSAQLQDDEFDFQGERRGRRDLDARGGRVQPSGEQRAAVESDQLVRWNRFGTPAVVTKTGAFLAEGLPADPVEATREWIAASIDLFGLSAEEVAGLEVLGVSPVGAGHAVLLRQRFDDLPAGIDGLVGVGVVDGRIAHAWSSLARDTEVTGEVQISAQDAVRAAAADIGRPLDAGDVSDARDEDGWTLFNATGFVEPARARLVAVPTPADGVRPAWETLLLRTGDAEGFSHFIDAESGDVLVRTDLVDYFNDPGNPEWAAFEVSPPLDYTTKDTRVRWCWEPAPECDVVVRNPASPVPWDVEAVTGTPWNTTRGNNARGTEKWLAPGDDTQGTVYATPSPEREYVYEWTNQWYEERCNPETTFTSPQRNDIDAAITNMFVGHNRMHDWSYHLGFTETTWNMQEHNFGRGGLENDPEHGNAQAGGIVGGPPTYTARDNANQYTPPDGVAPTTNMFLWQPIPAAFYAPCVDGDYDMTVIGHEYTHAISNRMVAGPDERLRDLQANAMGESWSDLAAMEHLHEYDLVPVDDENPWAVGPYVTSDQQRGIRNYGMNRSPLNYSNIGYDIVGPQVHADGEIWSATNFDIRTAMVQRYGDGTRDRQRRCAEGRLPAEACPGNYRWMQLVFDAWLLIPAQASMVDARDAMLAADLMRFGGRNRDLLWNAFARRGLGEAAFSNASADTAPIPDFTSPHQREATLRFQPVVPGRHGPVAAELYVGHYEARSRPVADTDPDTALGDTVALVPGTYDFVVRADGYGARRLTARVHAGHSGSLPVRLSRNLASAHNGATATGDGVNLDRLIDDTEATNWASLNAPVRGRRVIVRLDPSERAHEIGRVNVSAMLRPPIEGDADPGGQNRFTALRRFEILVCTAGSRGDCSTDAQFRSVYRSRPDAFPAVAPRPRAPDLIMRSFDIPRSHASHVQLRVLDNQCTGGSDFRGDQDDDPRHDTDCVTGSAAVSGVSQGENVRAAELQVFER